MWGCCYHHLKFGVEKYRLRSRTRLCSLAVTVEKEARALLFVKGW